MTWDEFELPPGAARLIRTERIVFFPDKTFKPLPTSSQYPTTSYLHLLKKAQWFVLFDRLAELQHVKLRNVDGSFDQHKVDYFDMMKEALDLCSWPTSPELLPLNGEEVASGGKTAPSPEKPTEASRGC